MKANKDSDAYNYRLKETMKKLSATIITFNEESNLKRCLDSLKGLVDEIIVVDSFSTDRTCDIAREYGAVVVQQKFNDFESQKNTAHNLATGEWVISLDADEYLDEELRASIIQELKNPKFNGYNFFRLNSINGHWIHYSGWNKDIKLRLVKRELSKWTGGYVHEVLSVEGETQRLKGTLLHHSYQNLDHFFKKNNQYSTMEAHRDYDKGKRGTLVRLITRPPWEVVRVFILKKGYKDGFYGFMITMSRALYVFAKEAKMIEFDKKP